MSSHELELTVERDGCRRRCFNVRKSSKDSASG
jgi:hypothetical protein